VRTPPVSWRGKALTVRAAPDCRAWLERLPSPDPPWQALLTSDRPLTLRGLELRLGPDGPAGGAAVAPAEGPAVCVQGAALALEDGRLRSAGRAPLVVVRDGGELGVKACRLEAGAVALSVEVGYTPCRVRLEGNTCTVREASGVVLSLWAAEVRGPTPVEV